MLIRKLSQDYLLALYCEDTETVQTLKNEIDELLLDLEESYEKSLQENKQYLKKDLNTDNLLTEKSLLQINKKAHEHAFQPHFEIQESQLKLS